MDALIVGEAMAKANDFRKRLEKAHVQHRKNGQLWYCLGWPKELGGQDGKIEPN
jgi:hypothetical protein